MKFLLVPLLIIGMFLSFAAALVAMLFFTQTVKTPQELVDIVLGNKDSTDVFEEFRLREDRLAELAVLTEEYRERYEAMTAQATADAESLAKAGTALEEREQNLEKKRAELGGQADSASQRDEVERLKQLAKFYDKIKAQRAAEILQKDGQLSDTTVANLMMMLQPQQMAKIMGSMDAEFAARITKVMKELPGN